jgi:hypothetical protein
MRALLSTPQPWEQPPYRSPLPPWQRRWASLTSSPPTRAQSIATAVRSDGAQAAARRLITAAPQISF